MKIAIVSVSVIALAAVCTAHLASADEGPRGVELGLRTGYAIPLGQASGSGSATVNGVTVTTQGADLSQSISGHLPIWFDAGYRLPNLYVGAYLQYGIAFIPSQAAGGTCGMSGVSCSGSDVMFGANAHYHILPAATFDPWVGAGIGYEWINVNASEGGVSGGEQVKGFQFFNLQAGGDYKVSPDFGLGPFVIFGVGQLDSFSNSGAAGNASGSIPNQAMHEWLTFGIRGEYDINLVGGSSHSSTARRNP